MKTFAKGEVEMNCPGGAVVGLDPTKDQEQPADEEEVWLDALEKGELDDNGEIPKERDLSMMTARQRALLGRASSIVAQSTAPSLPKESEEERRRRMEKNRKRKLQAVKKARETQKQTIRKLVEIPKASRDKQSAMTSSKTSAPMVRFVSRASSCTLSYPDGHDFPLQRRPQPTAPASRFCVVCGQPRRYSCSRTRASLCSLQCYSANLESAAS